jgi:hypothetical protein
MAENLENKAEEKPKVKWIWPIANNISMFTMGFVCGTLGNIMSPPENKASNIYDVLSNCSIVGICSQFYGYPSPQKRIEGSLAAITGTMAGEIIYAIARSQY